VRVLLDTNVLVRAFMESKGPASSVLQACLQLEHLLILSEEILFEVARVLRSSRIVAMHQKSEEAIYNFIWRLRIASAIIPPSLLAQTQIPDPNDIPILQAVLSG
jgi:putative PIN family toxin of toxin-antitoxin system